jgi:hypothetical protein
MVHIRSVPVSSNLLHMFEAPDSVRRVRSSGGN